MDAGAYAAKQHSPDRLVPPAFPRFECFGAGRNAGSAANKARYWSLASLRQIFKRNIGSTEPRVEAFGSLGLSAEDEIWVPATAKLLIRNSTVLKRLSTFVRPLILLTYSVSESVIVRFLK